MGSIELFWIVAVSAGLASYGVRWWLHREWRKELRRSDRFLIAPMLPDRVSDVMPTVPHMRKLRICNPFRPALQPYRFGVFGMDGGQGYAIAWHNKAGVGVSPVKETATLARQLTRYQECIARSIQTNNDMALAVDRLVQETTPRATQNIWRQRARTPRRDVRGASMLVDRLRFHDGFALHRYNVALGQCELLSCDFVPHKASRQWPMPSVDGVPESEADAITMRLWRARIMAKMAELDRNRQDGIASSAYYANYVEYGRRENAKSNH